MFVKKMDYKAMLVGIEVIRVEESYTSKASFLDLDEFTQEGCTGTEIANDGEKWREEQVQPVPAIEWSKNPRGCQWIMQHRPKSSPGSICRGDRGIGVNPAFRRRGHDGNTEPNKTCNVCRCLIT